MAFGVAESGLPRPRSMRSAPLARTRAVTASVMTKPYGGSASARGKDQLCIGAAFLITKSAGKVWTGRPLGSRRWAPGVRAGYVAIFMSRHEIRGAVRSDEEAL